MLINRKLALRLLLTFTLTWMIHPAYSFADTRQRDIYQFEQRLIQLVESSDYLSMRTLGIVRYDTFSSPIWLVTFEGDAVEKMKVFISGGVHGDEPAGLEAVLATIIEVANDPSKYEHVNIDFVPLVNPSGWVNGIRLNAAGEDINRDFHLLNSQETIIINDYLISRNRYKLMIDHHEDPRYPGFYMVTYGNSDLSLICDVTQKVKHSGYPLRSFKHNEGFFNVSNKMTPKLKNKTFMSYARSHYSKWAYQIESPTSPKMRDRTIMHSMADQELISSLR
jgi:hypothetical protein